ncbi:HAD-IC family P-type ATPase [Rhizobium sp. FY34]|uniref:cation-translocating P-type ATPase n=1 Tax=Rhizobium sp. FY34 TaxID=2562309 RepID=UPI001FF04073|nr:HAD-IC family P-type ATPase [Rhizobium sp. FY34]
MPEAGLSSAEARLRLERLGPNLIPEGRKPSFLRTFLAQFKSPLIYILLVAAGISLALGDVEDMIFILAVLVLNGLVGGVQEHSAGRAAAALRSLEQPHAMVIRDGRQQEIDAGDLVPGDLVLLEAGNRVPADLDLVEATDLLCDESLLTGESAPVRKRLAIVEPGASMAKPGSRPRLSAFAGALVTRGRGKGVVTATGATTEIGRIAVQIGRASLSRPPLMIRLDRFSRLIGIAVCVAVAVIAVIGLMRGSTLNDMFMMAVGLAVSAIPEGLPVAISVALAIGMSRMARHNVIVRRLPAVETLGSCTMIATDKTGTLTLNQLTVTDIRLPDGTGLVLQAGADLNACAILDDSGDAVAGAEQAEPLLRAALFPNEARLEWQAGEWQGSGDTVDVALLAAARKGGLDHSALHQDLSLLSRIPYEPDLKYAASFHRDPEQAQCVRLFVKGAPETVIAMADRMQVGGVPVAMDRQVLSAQVDAMAAEGLRVLAFAEGRLAAEKTGTYGPHHLVDLVFLGLAGMQDPIRAEVPAAIKACHAAGVEVAMVTGDDPRTAAAIARRAGLAFTPDQVVTGEDVGRAQEAGEAALDTLTGQARIYARVVPAQKLAIVLSLARNGHFVAVTGDGVNDAPALKHAHVGIAMGLKGTDVAKESADIIITDDNFASIISGIREGRVAYANIRKVIQMLAATGAAEMVLFLLAIPLGLPMPLLAVQLLWLNLVTNGIQDVALASEKAEGDELSRPPRRPDEPIFDPLMIRRVLEATLVMGLGGFAFYAYLLTHGYSEVEARNLLLLLLVFFENFQTFACRSERRSVFSMGLFSNPLLLSVVVAAQVLHLSAAYIPWLRDTLEVQPVTLAQWFTVMLIGSSVLIVLEVDKFISRRLGARRLAQDQALAAECV